jgi:hypothetical protein
MMGILISFIPTTYAADETTLHLSNNTFSALPAAMAYRLISTTTTTEATTTIDFTGLDSSVDGYYMVSIAVVGAAACNIACFVNNDTTTTNYYTQYIYSNNTTVSAARLNATQVTSTASGGYGIFDLFIKVVEGFAFISSVGSANAQGSGVYSWHSETSKTDALSGLKITRLTFTSGTNAMGAGTKISLYKVKN